MAEGLAPWDRLLRGEPAGEVARLVRRALETAEPPPPWVPPRPTLGEVEEALDAIARAAPELEARAEASRGEASSAAEEIERRAEARRSAGGERAAASWPLVGALRETAGAVASQDAEGSLRLAATAAELAGELDRDTEGGTGDRRLDADLAALAHAQHANSLRVASDLQASAAAFDRAFAAADRGSGDPLVAARLTDLLASLRSDQSSFEEAVTLAGRAARLYRRLGDRHGYGRARLKEATFHAYRGRLDRAVRTLTDALAHADPAAEPRLAFAAQHNLASYLDRLGRPGEALAALAEAEALCRDRIDRIRVAWLEGRVRAHLGERETGERLLREAREAFVELGIGYDTALVSMELAQLYTEQGRTAALERLAAEMVPLFATRDLREETRAALVLYCRAVAERTASLEMVEDLLTRLERSRA